MNRYHDTQSWERVMHCVREKYQIPGTLVGADLLSLPLPTCLRDLDVGASGRESLSQALVPRQVDTLVNESAELLSRCLVDQAEFYRLKVQAFDEWLRLLGFLLGDDVLTREIEAGSLSVSSRRARAELAAESAVRSALLQALKHVRERMDTYETETGHAEEVSKRGFYAQVGAYPATRTERPRKTGEVAEEIKKGN